MFLAGGGNQTAFDFSELDGSLGNSTLIATVPFRIDAADTMSYAYSVSEQELYVASASSASGTTTQISIDANGGRSTTFNYTSTNSGGVGVVAMAYNQNKNLAFGVVPGGSGGGAEIVYVNVLDVTLTTLGTFGSGTPVPMVAAIDAGARLMFVGMSSSGGAGADGLVAVRVAQGEASLVGSRSFEQTLIAVAYCKGFSG